MIGWTMGSLLGSSQEKTSWILFYIQHKTVYGGKFKKQTSNQFTEPKKQAINLQARIRNPIRLAKKLVET